MVVETTLEKVLNQQYDAILLTTMHSEYRSNTKLFKYLAAYPELVLFDFWGMLNTNEIKEKNIINKIIVTGRGDL